MQANVRVQQPPPETPGNCNGRVDIFLNCPSAQRGDGWERSGLVQAKAFDKPTGSWWMCSQAPDKTHDSLHALHCSVQQWLLRICSWPTPPPWRPKFDQRLDAAPLQ